MRKSRRVSRGAPLVRPRFRWSVQGAMLRLVACLLACHQTMAARAEPRAAPRSPAQRDTAGQWLQHRGDRALSGRTNLKGMLTSPGVLWKYDLSARETLLWARADADSSQLDLPTTDERPVEFDGTVADWRGVDAFDPDGTTPPSSPHGAVGKFLADRPGWQSIQFDQQGFCKLMTREHQAWVEVWRSEKIDDPMFGLNTITGDFDQDGLLEVAFTPWTHLHVLDLATGRPKAKAKFYLEDALGDGRPYGWFGAFDLDGDGKREFIIISDTQAYISVLGWREGSLGLLWGKTFQTKTESATEKRGYLVQPGVAPVQDLDGDGRLEIVFSFYEEPLSTPAHWEQGAWSTLVLDGTSGEVRRELTGERLLGLHDLDQDGRSELFCARTSGRPDDARRGSTVYRWQAGELQPIWRDPDSAFQMHLQPTSPDYVHSGAAAGLATCLVGQMEPDSRPVFFTRRAQDARAREMELSIWRINDQRVVDRVGLCIAPDVEALAARPVGNQHGVLLRTSVPRHAPAVVSTRNLHIQPAVSRRQNVPPSPSVVARFEPGAPPTIVVQEANERLVAIQRREGETQTKWDVAGRGMHEGSYHRTGGAMFGGITLANLHADERLAVVCATRGPHDQARLQALGPDGQELWHHDFDSLPGNPPGFTLPGLAFWFAGRFRAAERDDILVGAKAGVTTRLILLDGRTGEELWNKQAGGMYMASFDYDADGLDDALTTCWSEIHVIQGHSGQTLLKLETSPGNVFGPSVWPADAYSLAWDLLGRGRAQILYWPSYGARGLIDGEGKLVWQHQEEGIFFGIPSVYPGIADFDGDGGPEILATADHATPQAHTLRCFDGATGQPRWELMLDSPPGVPGSAITFDLDGDGREECIFPTGNVLYAVGERSGSRGAEFRWKLTLPAAMGPLAVADVEGTGRAQLVVVCEDGYLYGIGDAP